LRVVEYASPPDQPIWPKTKLLLLVAVTLGLMLGVMVALILELAFVRVNRFRLWERDSEYRVFAVVDQDEKFLSALYARPAEAKRIIGTG
jgi:tyrosine-protein kinase Etk/Wzc